MDQEHARKLFDEGAFLVLLDVPQNTEIGIDYDSWRSGPKFMGIKMIPPGLHYIYYSAVNNSGQAAPRTGFFHNFNKQETLVYRWDAVNEDVTTNGVTMDTVSRISSRIRELDGQLGMYPFDSLKTWYSLTNNITESLVRRLQPINIKISSVTQLVDSQCKDHVSSPKDHVSTGDHVSSKEQVAMGGKFTGVGEFSPVTMTTTALPYDHHSNLVKDDTACIRFTSLPTQKHPQGSSPRDITHHHMDLTYTLTSMLTSCYNNSSAELLGEVQLAFICFLIGHVYEAFEQWKKLICLLCSCEEAIAIHHDLYNSFIGVLHFQLKHIPKDFFVDIVSKDNFLTVTLKDFFANLEECPGANKDLVRRGLQFRDMLSKKYSWDFTSDLDEYAPVIIDQSLTDNNT